MLTYFPGLVKEAYKSGSNNRAHTPKLISLLQRDDGKIDAFWQALGSAGDTYSIRAGGSITKTEANGKLHYSGLNVSCDCIDAKKKSNCGSNLLCKHAFAALNSVIDHACTASTAAQIHEMQQEMALKKQRLEQEAPLIREEQEKKFPGERDRILYGLSVLPAEDIVKLLLTAITTADGLRACAAIFIPAVLPNKQIVTCTRCKEVWDLQYPGKCRISHVDGNTEWDTSKISFEVCGRCGEKHSFSYDNNNRNDHTSFNEEESWCFDGTHTLDQKHSEFLEGENDDEEDH